MNARQSVTGAATRPAAHSEAARLHAQRTRVLEAQEQGLLEA
jgi:hypothetical protein